MKRYALVLTAGLLISLLLLTGCGLLRPTPSLPGPDELATRTHQTVVAELTRIAAAWTPTFTVEPPTPEPPTPEPPTPDLAATQAYETAVAEMTRAAAEATATETLPTETPTLAPPTNTPLPTATAVATARPGPTATVFGGGGTCDRAEFISDVTVLQGSSYAPGATFTKTWRVRNNGTCTWTKDYDLVFVSGETMGGPAAVALKGDVKPGATVDLSVDLKAPAKTGEYQGSWLLSNASGARFGVGSQGNQPLIVKIKVSSLTEVAYDMVSKYCDAAWRNEDDALPCPGVDGDAAGFVIKVDNPTLENGITENEPALVVHPRNVTDGLTRGRFPEFAVRAGDRFRAVIGCIDGNSDCNVRMLLRYRIGGGNVITLQEWGEKFDGKVTRVDVDLTPLAGQKVQFVLTVRANGSPDGDRVFWLAPRIVR